MQTSDETEARFCPNMVRSEAHTEARQTAEWLWGPALHNMSRGRCGLFPPRMEMNYLKPFPQMHKALPGLFVPKVPSDFFAKSNSCWLQGTDSLHLSKEFLVSSTCFSHFSLSNPLYLLGSFNKCLNLHLISFTSRYPITSFF